MAKLQGNQAYLQATFDVERQNLAGMAGTSAVIAISLFTSPS